MKNTSKKSILIAVAAIALFPGIFAIPLEKIIVNTGVSDIMAEEISYFLKRLLIIPLAILGIKSLNLKALAGLDKQLPWERKYLILIPSYILIVGAVQIFEKDTSGLEAFDVLLLFISTMAIGFSEELVFRGLLQSIFIQANNGNKLFLSVLMPSVIFGAMHLGDFKTENASSEVSQFLYAIFFGVCFGAILIRTNKLIPLAIMHGLIDFVFGFSKIMGTDPQETSIEATDLSAEIINAIASSMVILPLLIVGILVLKKVQRESIYNKISLSKTADE